MDVQRRRVLRPAPSNEYKYHISKKRPLLVRDLCAEDEEQFDQFNVEQLKSDIFFILDGPQNYGEWSSLNNVISSEFDSMLSFFPNSITFTSTIIF
jgi:hypothetical protein